MMHDDPSSSIDDLSRWLGDDTGPPSMPSAGDDDTTGRPARRLLLVSGLLVPWLVAAGVLAFVGGRTPGAGRTRAAGPPIPAPTGRAAPAEPTPSTPTPSTPTPSTPTRRGAAPAATAATAVRLVRDAVTDPAGPHVAAVDVAAAEAPTALAPGVWVVRVHVVVLHGDHRRWHSATHEVWAAPVGERAGDLVGLDRPWRVGAPAATISDAGWRAATAIAPGAVRAALRNAGITAPAAIDIQRHPVIPGVVRAGVDDRHHVWLRTTPSLHVVGREVTDGGP